MRIALLLCWLTFAQCSSHLYAVAPGISNSVDGSYRNLSTLRGIKKISGEAPLNIDYPAAPQKGSKKGFSKKDGTYEDENEYEYEYSDGYSKKGTKSSKKDKRSGCE